MSTPFGRSQFAKTLLVEVEMSPGSGRFAVDDRLRAEEVVLASDERISKARISVRLSNDFGTMDARERYHPGLRLAIRTDHIEPSSRATLFEGYAPAQETRWDGRPSASSEEFVFEAEHVYEPLARARGAQILGRHVRSGEVEDGLASDPTAWCDKSTLVTALPCVFNFDGRGNCSPTPLAVRLASGEMRSIYIFTHDDDPGAIRWTFANALRYLVWFYVLGECPVLEGNIFSASDGYADKTPDDRASISRSDAPGRALLRAPESLNCEATNVIEALGLAADAAGLHITPETVNENGQIRTQLKLWCPSAGKVRWLKLGAGGVDENGQPRYDVASKTVREVLADNQVYRGKIRWEHAGIVNSLTVVGDVKQYEMTVDLVPGWLPKANLDDVTSEQRSAAKALALTPDEVEALGDAVRANEWFTKYHRQGSEHKYNAQVARRWVLNEDGRYAAAAYNRNEPFDDYKPFDFSTVFDATVTAYGDWMRRARRFLPTITRTAEGHKPGVLVEVSFDSGSTWHEQSSGVRLFDDECGVFFECDNPTAITPPATPAGEQNLWYAIIDQTFRVRVTGVVETDDRLIYEKWPERMGPGTNHISSRILYCPEVFGFVSREHTTNVLASVNPSASGIGRDDTAAMAALAEEVAPGAAHRRIGATPVIPWIDTEYAIGDRIAGVRGRGIEFTEPTRDQQACPSIIGKRYRSSGQRYETELILENRGLIG